MTDVVIKKPYSFLSQSITCLCGSEELHQREVSVFWRDGEDSQTGKNIRSTLRATESFLTQGENPSPRRDGLLVKFSCEQCDSEPELAIYQHKGRTCMKWHSARQKLDKKPA